MAPARSFAVDARHLGRSEAAWAASPAVRLPVLRVPRVSDAVLCAPHPDDEVLGAGGLLLRLLAAGTSVEVWGVTDGEACFGPLDAASAGALGERRTGEAAEALRRLGAPPDRRRLGQRDGAVDQRVVEDALVARLTSDSLCVAPWRGDGHPDHDAVGTAAWRACRSTGATLLAYPIWAWHWADPLGTDLPWADGCRLALSPREVATKSFAIGAFTSQVEQPTDSGLPVLPPAVLARFRRPCEVFFR